MDPRMQPSQHESTSKRLARAPARVASLRAAGHSEFVAELVVYGDLSLAIAEAMDRRTDEIIAYRVNVSAALRTAKELGDRSMLRVLSRDAV